MYQHGSYVHCVRTSIIRKGVSAGEFCAYLLALPVFDSIKLKLSLLSDIRAELEKATTINGIFNVLNSNYATFIKLITKFSSVLQTILTLTKTKRR